jgi:phosphoribosylformylglycinamidine cyclo-ligase
VNAELTTHRTQLTYAGVGVDIGAAEENVRRIGHHVRSTHGPAVLGNFGAFAGLFHLAGVSDPVLVASTDGVGTKLLLGLELGRYDLLGRDLVNLSVNDVLTTGARPLFFLDYVGVHALDHALMEELVAGMAAACRENGCALLGGETAQLPELYAPGLLDLVGSVVGVVERSALIDGSRVQPGDRVWGLPSTGLHTNGFTLARKIVSGLDLSSDPDGRLGQSLGEALLAPHPSYFLPLQPLAGLKAMEAVVAFSSTPSIPTCASCC